MTEPPHHPSNDRYRYRAAKKEDITAMTDVWYNSFALAPFWAYILPDDATRRKWWLDSLSMGIDDPGVRTVVVEDTQKDNKIVAYSRWMKPKEGEMPEPPYGEIGGDNWDMDVANAVFGGMEQNRHDLMGKRPHWMLEIICTDADYQNQGIGSTLMRWGIEQADAAGIETYLDGTEVGAPWYMKHFGYEPKAEVPIPDKPEYGSYGYKSFIRQPHPK